MKPRIRDRSVVGSALPRPASGANSQLRTEHHHDPARPVLSSAVAWERATAAARLQHPHIVPLLPVGYYDVTKTKVKWTVRVSDTVRNFKTGEPYSFTLDVMPELP